MNTRFVKGDRVILVEDGMSGTVYRVLSGADVDWCAPIYEIVWDHAPGMTAYGSRHYGPALALLATCDACDGKQVYMGELCPQCS